jgi:uncharacterized protein (TIGR02444 family)
MSSSAFWDFSLKFYALPGVAAACIELQDHHGVDVNVLLHVLFLAVRGRAVTRDDVARIDAAVAGWRREVVVPLRSVRRSLRDPVAGFDPDRARSLRTEVKRIELEAERIQQETLERLSPAGGRAVAASARAAAARTNLAAYSAHLGGLPDALLAPMLGALEAQMATQE